MRRIAVPLLTAALLPAAAVAQSSTVVTNMKLDNGQTAVIGGLLQDSETLSVNKVPFLGDIPYIGVAFRSKQRVDNKAELLIFVTPRILEEGGSIY